MYLPLTLLLFALLNRLSRRLATHRIGAVLRDYSFWLQLWLVSVVQNLSSLWFFCLKELQVLFSLAPVMRMLRMLTVPLTGLIVIGSVCLFFLCRSLYGSCARYFFINTRTSRANSMYMLLRYILKPLVETAIHVFFTADSERLLTALALSSAATLLGILLIEACLSLHRYKMIFVSDCLVEFSLISCNILLLFKQFYDNTDLAD